MSGSKNGGGEEVLEKEVYRTFNSRHFPNYGKYEEVLTRDLDKQTFTEEVDESNVGNDSILPSSEEEHLVDKDSKKEEEGLEKSVQKKSEKSTEWRELDNEPGTSHGGNFVEVSASSKDLPQNASDETVLEGEGTKPLSEVEASQKGEEREKEASFAPPWDGVEGERKDSAQKNETEVPPLHVAETPEGGDVTPAAVEVDANMSAILPAQEALDDSLKEKDQLETYSQFAERVTAEKKNGASGPNGHGSNGQSTKGPKVKTKNYASADCGAKFVAANPESSHSHKIINSNKDEYMLNKCTGKIWAIVELCESIRPQKFDIANFELFSNSPREIYLFGSHRYPTREWAPLGAYEGEEGNRDVQSFNVEALEFFKYIKLEVHTYYGTEFFCPLSLFKIYGLSEFEVIEETEDSEEEQIIEEEVTEEDKTEETNKEKPGMIPDVIKSVLSGVLQVIKRGSRSGNITDEPELNTFTQSCRSLHKNFSIKGEACSFAESLNYILACYYDEYLKLMMNPFIAAVVHNTEFCHQLATIICTSPNNNDSYVYDSVCNNSYACVMLSPKHILAMCHMQDLSILNDSTKCSTDDSHPPENVSTTGTIDSATLDVTLLVEDPTKTDSVSDERTHEEGEEGVPTPSHPSPSHSSSKEEEKNVSHLSHVDFKPKVSKDHPKKSKDSHAQPSDKSPNATDNASDKPGSNSHGEKKKEQKAEKESADKAVSSDDSSQSIATNSPPTTAVPPTSSESRVGSHSNKESVVVRLSNKIKVLENNMSISSQYLEELSRRYKRQMEDMQRQFNITILALNSTSQTAYERDLYHQKRLESLENQLEGLMKVVTTLAQEKESLLTSVIEQHMILLFVEVIVMLLVFSLCLRRRRAELMRMPDSANVKGVIKYGGRVRESSSLQLEADQQGRETPSLCRRRSVDSIRAESETKPRERRFSGQISMTGSYRDLLLTETTTKERKKKKKKPHLERSLSNVSIGEKSRSCAPTKKEKKLEKLKRSSAGVLFSAERGANQEPRLEGHISSLDTVSSCERMVGVSQDEWHVVKKSKSKTKNEKVLPYSDEYVLSSDLKRGKITLDKDQVCNIHDYYTEMPYEHSYNVGYLDIDCNKDTTRYNYSTELESNSVRESFHNVYTPELDYNSPVINHYYYAAGEHSYYAKNGDSFKGRNNHEDGMDAALWGPTKIPKSLTKTRSLGEFRTSTVPSSFKGKTKLRSDNWEWYSSQPSRLLSNCASTSEVVSNSSSDSSVKSKQFKVEHKGETLKTEKKKRKKSKGIKLCNGESR